jgi:acyl dehydratase
VNVGDPLGVRQFPVRLPNLVRYAGAGGDFNPIHWNQRVARSVGLPDVIAHGMFTMAQVGRYVTDWAGDPGAVETFDVRFTAPVAVPDDDAGAVIEVSGTVAEVLDEGRVALHLQATCDGVAVLKDARAIVQLRSVQ